MRIRTILRAVPLAIVLGLAVSGSAWAELINLQFNATISAYEGEEDPALRALFPLGGTASWLLTYDTTLAEAPVPPATDPSIGWYESTSIDWQGQISGASYTLQDWVNQRLFVQRDLPGLSFDNSIAATSTLGAITGDLIHSSGADWFGQAFDFSVSWAGSAPFTSDALPGTLPSGNPSGNFTFYLHNACPPLSGCTERQLRVLGNITSVASVPEPATLALVALGAVVLTRRRSRRP